MPSLRQIRRRIRSVENTKKITRAMEMVAAAKLHRFEELLDKARGPARFLDELLKNLAGDVSAYDHPLFRESAGKKTVALITLTSDAGLCGTYNANCIQKALGFLAEHAGDRVKRVFVGRNGLNFFKRRGEAIEASFVEIRLSNFESMVRKTCDFATEGFLTGKFDEVYLLYTQFVSKSAYRPVVEKFLNLSRPPQAVPGRIGYILEPNAERIFEVLLPRYLASRMRMAFLEAFLSEQVARMMAMRQATDNAEQMIDELTLLRNKLRQASITKELIEVVSGARALKR